MLGRIYRVAERAGAWEWALTSEQVFAAALEHAGVVNEVFADANLLAEFAPSSRNSQRAERADAAHKVLLRTWANGGVAAADEVMFDMAMPVFGSKDAIGGIASAVNAIKAARPRPALPFEGAWSVCAKCAPAERVAAKLPSTRPPSNREAYLACSRQILSADLPSVTLIAHHHDQTEKYFARGFSTTTALVDCSGCN